MKLHELRPAYGAKTTSKRLGRGVGSGKGGKSTRGTKGQKSRSGGFIPLGFEGGQMPLIRRLPKRGFSNAKFAKQYTVVNVSQLNSFDDGDVIDIDTLLESGTINQRLDGLKILGNGELSKKLTVKAKKFTKSAEEKIEAAGGSIEVV